MTWDNSSGSRRSDKAVESTRSQNMTVSWRRSVSCAAVELAMRVFTQLSNLQQLFYKPGLVTADPGLMADSQQVRCTAVPFTRFAPFEKFIAAEFF